TLPQDPGISNVEERSHCEDMADDRKSIFQVQHTLRVATDINDIVKRPRHRVSGFRIGDVAVSHNVGNCRTLPEMKSADGAIAAKEKPLVVRHGRVAEAGYE